MDKKSTFVPTLCVCGHVDVGKSTFVGRLLSLGTDKNDNQLLEEPVEQFARAVDTVDEIKQKNKGATQNFACNQLKIRKRLCCVIDNPGHLELIHQVAKSLHLADVLILICQADKLPVSMAYCKLMRFIASIFSNIQKVAVIVNKIDLNPDVDVKKIGAELKADFASGIHHKSSDEEFLAVVDEILQLSVNPDRTRAAAWLFDQDVNGGKSDQQYFKTSQEISVVSERLSIWIAGKPACIEGIRSFSSDHPCDVLQAGEYFTGRAKDIICGIYDFAQTEDYHNQQAVAQFKVRGRTNRQGTLVQLQKYVGYCGMQYFECDVRGKDTIRPVKSNEDLEILVVPTRKVTFFGESSDCNKIVLFNRFHRNPLIFIGTVIGQ